MARTVRVGLSFNLKPSYKLQAPSQPGFEAQYISVMMTQPTLDL